MWSPMYEVLVGPSAALVGGFMFPFRAGECDLLWASGVEGAVLLAEAVLEEDLKRLRLRCWLRWGRGMFGQRSRHRLLLRARGCLVFGRLLAAGMIETGPPIVVIGGVQRAAASKQVGDAKWQAVHYISQVRQRRQQRCLAQAGRRSRLVWPAVGGGGAIGSAMRVPRVGEQEAQDANAL